MLDSGDVHDAGDSASPSRPARGLVRPRGPAGPGQNSSTGSHDSRGSSQHTAGGSQEANENGTRFPDAAEIVRRLEVVGNACALGFMDPTQARATASIFKDMNQVRVQDENAERAAAAAKQSAPNSGGANGSGESAGRPSPGAPRMVPASIVDAMLEVAMTHQPQLLRDLEPVLDDEQLKLAAEFLQGSLGPGEPDDDRS